MHLASPNQPQASNSILLIRFIDGSGSVYFLKDSDTSHIIKTLKEALWRPAIQPAHEPVSNNWSVCVEHEGGVAYLRPETIFGFTIQTRAEMVKAVALFKDYEEAQKHSDLVGFGRGRN